jgi:dihydrolipoamide dehydrogenase
VTSLTSGIEFLFKKNKVDYLKGWGKFSGQGELEIDLTTGGKEKIKAKNVIIATGSTSNHLPGNTLKVDQQNVVTSTGALALKQIPKKMVVIGAGVIGLELGSVYQRIGTEVTVIGNTDRLCPSMDIELSSAFKKSLDKQGMKFIMKSRVQGGVGSSNGCRVDYTNADGASASVEADVVLVATGRRAFTDGLQLDRIGLETDKFGRIETNEHFETKIKGVFAIGDVIKGPMLAHKAEEEGIAAVEHIIGEGGHINYNTIPGVIYTHPEVGSVGKTEEELKAAGIKYRKGVFPFMANSRARTNHESDGFVKILVDAENNKIVGVHIIGPNAGEMLAEGVLAMEYGASAQDIGRTCHAHPTLSEAFKEACMAAYDKPIHM